MSEALKAVLALVCPEHPGNWFHWVTLGSNVLGEAWPILSLSGTVLR